MKTISSESISLEQTVIGPVDLDYVSELPPSWDDFVRDHPYGSPFHLGAWQRMINRTFGHEPRHILAREKSTGRIAGVLPLFLVRSRLFGKLLVSTPQAAYGGILAGNDTVALQILEKARKLANEQNVQFLELRSHTNPVPDTTLPIKDLYVTFRQELHRSPDENMLAIPRKTRAEVREGIRHGLEFKVDEISTRQFFDIYSHSVHALGTPVFSHRLFEIGKEEFGSECRIFSVHWQNKLVAAVWTLFYKDEVVPYFGGSIREYNRLAVNSFMYGMLIRYGGEHGYRIFDFGRSKKGTGSFDFKRRWGMKMADLPYQYVLVRQKSMPDTSPLNPKFSLGIEAWRRLPLSVTRVIGPLISRHVI